MTNSITPAVVVTQTGGAQVAIITPSRTITTTPAIGFVVGSANQTVEVNP